MTLRREIPSVKVFLMTLLVAVSLGGCTNPGIVQLNHDTYLLSRSSAAGMFVNMPKLKAQVIQEAQSFASARGKRAEPVNMNETFPAHGFPSFDYEFRLVDTSK
jgi:hypothetical protein